MISAAHPMFVNGAHLVTGTGQEKLPNARPLLVKTLIHPSPLARNLQKESKPKEIGQLDQGTTAIQLVEVVPTPTPTPVTLSTRSVALQ